MIALYVRSHPTQNAWKDDIDIHAKKHNPLLLHTPAQETRNPCGPVSESSITYLSGRRFRQTPAHQLSAAPAPRPPPPAARPQFLPCPCPSAICAPSQSAQSRRRRRRWRWRRWRLHFMSIHQPGRRPQRACWPRSHQRPLGVSHASTGPRRTAVTHLAVSGVHVLPECRSCESGCGEVVCV